MSGAYEHSWMKHDVPAEAMQAWQNKLPLYNLRLSNLSAAIIRPQLPELARRVRDGRRNHDHVASLLNASPWLTVPEKLPPEQRAPDSIQFNLVGMTEDQIGAFAKAAAARGVKVQIFGRSTDNARAFWNWQFLGRDWDLPQTRAMLMSACDVRLPARLSVDECSIVAGELVAAAQDAMTAPGTAVAAE